MNKSGVADPVPTASKGGIELPPRATISAARVSALGLGGFAAAWATCHFLTLPDTGRLLVFVALTALPMLAAQAFNCRDRFLAPALRPFDGLRFYIKMIGLLLTLAVVVAFFWFGPWRHSKQFSVLWHLASTGGGPLLVLLVPYFAWMDQRMREPKDGYWQTGALALGRWREMDWGSFAAHWRGWLIKAFFLPYMLIGVGKNTGILVASGVDFTSFAVLYVSLISLIYTLDIVWGAVGYLCMIQVLDTHIRSSDRTWTGWLSALCCYGPFYTFVWGKLDYKGQGDWSSWLAPHPLLYVTWGFAILLLLALYVWATISFGLRFSNLTNRGIVTHGPYRLMKHPAYVSKNLSWWLMSVPFITHSSWTSVLWACICLALVNLIYFIRALTEERHLGKDPDYRAYSTWVEKNGLWGAIMGKIGQKRYAKQSLSV